ncbi:hypothetical protein, partial [Streptomyces sp. NPDC088178]|uniref:hypothetical protein n=1 Tax=Streptomyces sp. NPDC088178 TaxID=3365836 RepID=UPI00381EAED2
MSDFARPSQYSPIRRRSPGELLTKTGAAASVVNPHIPEAAERPSLMSEPTLLVLDTDPSPR